MRRCGQKVWGYEVKACDAPPPEKRSRPLISAIGPLPLIFGGNLDLLSLTQNAD